MSKVLPGFLNLLGIHPMSTVVCLARMMTMPPPPWILLLLLLLLLILLLQFLLIVLVLSLLLPTPTPTGMVPRNACFPASVPLAELFPPPGPTSQTPLTFKAQFRD